MKVLIIIPAYNEQGNIENVIKQIQTYCSNCDVLVVNDCSKDNTEKIINEKKIPYISLPVNLGIGGAVQAGYEYAKKNNYDVAIQVDGDGQHDVSYVSEMVDIIEREEADIVIGSRFINKEGFQSSICRRIGIHILSDLVLMCTGKRVRDVTSGFRAVNRNFIEIYADNYPDDYPEPEAIVEAFVHGGKIIELPVVMKKRENGSSSINFRKSVYYMIKVSLEIIICRASYGIRR